jgi:hypothetical protein
MKRKRMIQRRNEVQLRLQRPLSESKREALKREFVWLTEALGIRKWKVPDESCSG